MGVRGQPSEMWFVWYSEEWTSTLVDLQFADSVYGDVVIAFRDNKGRSSSVTGPDEQFITMHPRMIQQNSATYQRFYSTAEDRLSRLTLVSMSSPISGVNTISDVNTVSSVNTNDGSVIEYEALAITDMYVIPTGKEGRRPWILLSFIVAKTDSNSITESQRVDVCNFVNVDLFVRYLGSQEGSFRKCDLNNFFEINRQSGYIPVALPSTNILEASLVLIPTQKGSELCTLKLSFVNTQTLSAGQGKNCYETPDSFTSNAIFPTASGWMDMQRTMFSGETESARRVVVTQQGIVNSMAKRVLCQNTLSVLDPAADPLLNYVQLFASGDPDSATHWLSQIRLRLHVNDAGRRMSVSSISKPSQQVDIKVVTLHSCDRLSCLGCKSLKLQVMHKTMLL